MAIILGLLFFTLLSYFRSGNLVMGFAANGDIWVYLVPLIAMISYFEGNFIFARALTAIKNKGDIKQKSISYVRVAACRYGFLSLAAFIGILPYRENNIIFY